MSASPAVLLRSGRAAFGQTLPFVGDASRHDLTLAPCQEADGNSSPPPPAPEPQRLSLRRRGRIRFAAIEGEPPPNDRSTCGLHRRTSKGLDVCPRLLPAATEDGCPSLRHRSTRARSSAMTRSGSTVGMWRGGLGRGPGRKRGATRPDPAPTAQAGARPLTSSARGLGRSD